MPVLDELAAFIVGYCVIRTDRDPVRVRWQLDSILAATVLPAREQQQAALFGFAYEIGATAADGFNPAWTP